jgi:hypothetical protein
MKEVSATPLPELICAALTHDKPHDGLRTNEQSRYDSVGDGTAAQKLGGAA